MDEDLEEQIALLRGEVMALKLIAIALIAHSRAREGVGTIVRRMQAEIGASAFSDSLPQLEEESMQQALNGVLGQT